MHAQHTVSLLETECSGCYLSCQDCGACLHKFKCSCLDFPVHCSVCKHIHAVALWKMNKESLSLNENSDDLAIPSSSTSNQYLQDPQSLLEPTESSAILEVQDCDELGSIQTKLAAVVQAFPNQVFN